MGGYFDDFGFDELALEDDMCGQAVFSCYQVPAFAVRFEGDRVKHALCFDGVGEPGDLALVDLLPAICGYGCVDVKNRDVDRQALRFRVLGLGRFGVCLGLLRLW